jgi:hypothetical protein
MLEQVSGNVKTYEMQGYLPQRSAKFAKVQEGAPSVPYVLFCG